MVLVGSGPDGVVGGRRDGGDGGSDGGSDDNIEGGVVSGVEGNLAGEAGGEVGGDGGGGGGAVVMTSSPCSWEDEDADPSVVGRYLFGSGSALRGSVERILEEDADEWA